MTLLKEQVRIAENERLAANLHLMRLASPGIAQSVLPGQFVHMGVPGMDGHILRRPFSIYSRDAAAGTLEILYQTVGCGSTRMAELSTGDTVSLIGPVGTPWMPPEGAKRALLVGGGVGAAPLFMLFERLIATGIRTEVVLGAATKECLVCKPRYEALLGREPRCATDDGSYGRAGFCTLEVRDALDEAAQEGRPYDYVAVCGPEPLMRIVSDMAAEAGVSCQVSMERRMACGIGACLSCVVDTSEGKKRACVDGPVFDARKVIWA